MCEYYGTYACGLCFECLHPKQEEELIELLFGDFDEPVEDTEPRGEA